MNRLKQLFGGENHDPRFAPEYGVADLYNDLEQPRKQSSLRALLPGLVVVGLATLAAAYISQLYGAPLTLMALLVGLALNFLHSDQRLKSGLTFASGSLLRLSIVLVGAQVTTAHLATLGPSSALVILLIVIITIASGALAGRWLGLGSAFGTLAGGAVAICGASAALALSTVLGERRINGSQLALVLVGISGVSSLAMVLYPILAHHLGLSDPSAGFLLGASIHDVAQTLGAGYSFSPEAGEVAAIVKMGRVALLAPALIMVSLAFPERGSGTRRSFLPPWFVVGFFAVAAASAAGIVPREAGDAAGTISRWLLAAAVTATGIRSPMNNLLHSGARPFVVIIAATLTALAASLAAALLLF